ncbi:hypothetical protein [Chitinimonas sp.]|uniref:hypothetical protein n=1 Tax=Chitinimonas sp. TaxID=1934313 RepID=UPI0035B02EE5
MNRCALLVALTLLSPCHAAEPAATPAALPPPPPQWERAIPARVLIGAEVGVGVDAVLTQAPLLLRIEEPRRLRDAGSKASECVVDAEAHGNLAAERVLVRLSGIRCFDGEGEPVLNKRIHGYVVDVDGRSGCKGALMWSQPAKDLVMLGAGAQSRQNFLVRGAQTAVSRATLGIGDSLFGRDDDKAPLPDTIRELRSTDTLLPVLTLEAGRQLRLVILGGIQ